MSDEPLTPAQQRYIDAAVDHFLHKRKWPTMEELTRILRPVGDAIEIGRSLQSRFSVIVYSEDPKDEIILLPRAIEHATKRDEYAKVAPRRVAHTIRIPEGVGPQKHVPSVLVRPFQALLGTSGHPPGAPTNVYLHPRVPADSRIAGRRIEQFTPEELAIVRESPPRALGVFTTANRMLCFFPGLTNRDVVSQYDEKKRTMRPMRIDHFTLEPNRHRWHITGERREDRRPPRFEGHPVDRTPDGLLRWFGLMIPKFEDLELVPHEVKLEGQIPPERLQYVYDKFVEGVSEGNGGLLMVTDNRVDAHAPSFLFVEVLVTPQPDVPSRKARPFTLPDIARPFFPKGHTWNREDHSIDVAGFDGRVWLQATLLNGELHDFAMLHHLPNGPD